MSTDTFTLNIPVEISCKCGHVYNIRIGDYEIEFQDLSIPTQAMILSIIRNYPNKPGHAIDRSIGGDEDPIIVLSKEWDDVKLVLKLTSPPE